MVTFIISAEFDLSFARQGPNKLSLRGLFAVEMAAQASMARRFHILIKLVLIALIVIGADFACLPKTADVAAQAPDLVFAQAATHHLTNDNHGPGSDSQERGDDHCVQYKLMFQSNICRTDPVFQLIRYSAGSNKMSGSEWMVINRPPIRAA